MQTQPLLGLNFRRGQPVSDHVVHRPVYVLVTSGSRTGTRQDTATNVLHELFQKIGDKIKGDTR